MIRNASHQKKNTNVRLNCGLCPMNLNQYCSGCGGGEGNQACSIAKCSLQHGNVEYCFQCESYPCERYENIYEFDSFITHQHQKRDMEKFKELGVELYSAEQQRKKVLLNHLLNTYNDGRKKTLFCVAVNLLELDDLENIAKELNIPDDFPSSVRWYGNHFLDSFLCILDNNFYENIGKGCYAPQMRQGLDQYPHRNVYMVKHKKGDF